MYLDRMGLAQASLVPKKTLKQFKMFFGKQKPVGLSVKAIAFGECFQPLYLWFINHPNFSM